MQLDPRAQFSNASISPSFYDTSLELGSKGNSELASRTWKSTQKGIDYPNMVGVGTPCKQTTSLKNNLATYLHLKSSCSK